MKLITFFLIFITYFCEAQEYVVYCNSYKTAFSTKNVAVVIHITKDSIKSYIPEIGYFTWLIDAVEYENITKDSRMIDNARYKLSYASHHSYMVISNKKVLQLIYLDGYPPLVFSIEFTINQKIKPK